MGCACSKNKKTTAWASSGDKPAAPPQPTPTIHVAPDGTETLYGSRLEALSARIRFGGEIKPAA